METMNDDVLHIFAQSTWHGDAAICGTRLALTNLRNAIEKALQEGKLLMHQQKNKTLWRKPA